MRRTLLWGWAVTAALLACATAAPACLNDSEVKNAEREFKSQYQFQTQYRERPAPESPAADESIGPVAATGLGSLLLLAAAALCFRKSD